MTDVSPYLRIALEAAPYFTCFVFMAGSIVHYITGEMTYRQYAREVGDE